MNPICLLIPDNALRTAVAEQLALSDFELVKEYDSVAQVLDADKQTVLIIDEVVCDKKTLGTLRKSKTENRCVFLLGAIAEESDLFTETFSKPLRLGHLLERLKFYLETAPRLRGKSLTFGPYRLEPHNRQIMAADGTVIRLTEKETALLEYLGHATAPVPREELLAAIWGYDGRIDTHTLETHIYQLRRKLSPGGEDSSILVNEQGAYRLVAS